MNKENSPVAHASHPPLNLNLIQLIYTRYLALWEIKVCRFVALFVGDLLCEKFSKLIYSRGMNVVAENEVLFMWGEKFCRIKFV